MSDSRSAAWSSSAVPFTPAELREYEERFAEFDGEIQPDDSDVRWPGESDGAP